MKRVVQLQSLQKKRNIFIFVTLLIPVVLLILFVVYPVLNLFRMSLTSWDGLSSIKEFIGIKNYTKMFTQSPDLWRSLKNNFVYFFVHLLFIPVELAIAVMLTNKARSTQVYKTMTFLPYIINGVAISYAFAYFFSPINGGFNAILTTLGLESWIRNWLSDEKIVNYVLSFVSLWRFSGYHIILFISALTSVPEDILEAATIDGAGAVQKFFKIQLPSISLVIDFILFDNVRGALQAFDIPFVMTNGGPGYASSTFTLYTINTAFTYNNFGMASAMAVVIILLIVGVYLIQNVIVRSARTRSERKGRGA